MTKSELINKFLLVYAVFSTALCCSYPRLPVANKRMLVADIEKKTVAFVKPGDEEGNMVPYCAGVWVDQNKILTAYHCVIDEQILLYQVNNDDSGIARVAAVDEEDVKDDLVILKTIDTSTPKNHPIASIAKDVWPGQHVNIVGHTTGLWWSYIDGTVASERVDMTMPDRVIPLSLQITSAAWLGNSGGGAFDDDGNLVGISSWISLRAPLMSFFIHQKVLDEFVCKARQR